MHLSEIAARTPGKTAVMMSDGGAAVSYAEPDRRSLPTGKLLRRRVREQYAQRRRG